MKTVLLLLLDQYADWEASYVAPWILAMGQGQYTVKTVSLTKEPIHSMGGLTTLPDYDLQSVPEDYTALLLVGGLSWRKEEAKQVIPLVHDALNKQRFLGGICDASAFLGTIGVLNDVKHTCNDLHDVKQWAGDAYTGDANYQMQQAVCDGNIVTANGTAPLEFAKEVLLALEIAPKDYVLGWYNFHKLSGYNAPMPQM